MSSARLAILILINRDDRYELLKEIIGTALYNMCIRELSDNDLIVLNKRDNQYDCTEKGSHAIRFARTAAKAEPEKLNSRDYIVN